jgi:hypothetical protein
MTADGTVLRRWIWLAGVLAVAACAGEPEAPAEFDPVAADTVQYELGLRQVVASGDPLAVAALVGANPGFAAPIVVAAVTAHPTAASGISAASAAQQPDLAPDIAAAAATANPAAAPDIVRKTAAVVPDRRAAIGEAVLAALLPDERLALEAMIAKALDEAKPPTLDDWAVSLSKQP